MSRPTTLRLPEALLENVDRWARQEGMDRASYLRRLIQSGLRQEETRALLADYAAGRRSAGQVCEALSISPWDFPDLLRTHGLQRNVTLEDWLGSARPGGSARPRRTSPRQDTVLRPARPSRARPV